MAHVGERKMAWSGVLGERKMTGSGVGGVLGETKIVWSGVSITVGLYPTCPTKTLVFPRFSYQFCIFC